jgi:hypothetical protein
MFEKPNINRMRQTQRLVVRKKRKLLNVPPWLLGVAFMQLYWWLSEVFNADSALKSGARNKIPLPWFGPRSLYV